MYRIEQSDAEEAAGQYDDIARPVAAMGMPSGGENQHRHPHRKQFHEGVQWQERVQFQCLERVDDVGHRDGRKKRRHRDDQQQTRRAWTDSRGRIGAPCRIDVGRRRG